MSGYAQIVETLRTIDTITQICILLGQILVIGLIVTAVVERSRGALGPGSGWLIASLVAFAVALTPLDLVDFHQSAQDQPYAWRIVPLAVVVLPALMAQVVRRLTGLRSVLDVPIAMIAVLAAGWVLLMPTYPGARYEPRPWWFEVGVGMLAVELVLVTFVMVSVLRRAARDQPHLARVRGRALVVSVLLFGVSILFWLASPTVAMSLVTSIAFASSPVAFYVAIRAPHTAIRFIDPKGERSFSDAIASLVASVDVRDDLPDVLTGIARSAGFVGIAMLDADRNVVEIVGHMPFGASGLLTAEVETPPSERSGVRFVAWTTALSPRLSPRDRVRLSVLAELVEMALDRADAASVEREAARALKCANQKLREADAIKDRFVALVSHELRTPLTTVIGLARTASDRWNELDDPQLQEFQGIIAAQGERLLQIVNDLLTVARFDSGAVLIEPAELRLDSVIGSAVDDAGFHDSSSVRIEASVEAWHTDQRIVHDVLVNYLANAHKYGAPPIEVQAFMRDDELEIVVRDHGDGVPHDVQPRLFDRFFRGTTVGTIPGSGLGLSIVREYAELLGGSAGYRAPESGVGAEFFVRLPRCEMPPAP